MTFLELFRAEFDEEMKKTRRMLESIPDTDFNWKPHEKSMSAGQLAYHLALVPGRIIGFVQHNPAEGPGAGLPQPANRQEILDAFDKSIATVRNVLPTFDDAAMNEIWRLLVNGQEIVAQPRGEFLRDIMFSHWYQHRGQFSVYLRLLNIPVPASWGPSADEVPSARQKA